MKKSIVLVAVMTFVSAMAYDVYASRGCCPGVARTEAKVEEKKAECGAEKKAECGVEKKSECSGEKRAKRCG